MKQRVSHRKVRRGRKMAALRDRIELWVKVLAKRSDFRPLTPYELDVLNHLNRFDGKHVPGVPNE